MRCAWRGPKEEGVTQSIISRSLECPYRFFLYAALGLEEPRQVEPNLIWGDGAHKALEHLIEIPKFIKDMTEEEYEGCIQKAKEYMEEEYPSGYYPTYIHSIRHMMKLYDDSYKQYGPYETEVKLNDLYTTRLGREITIRGKVDAINYSKGHLIEHKCKGKIDLAQVRVEIPFDMQVLLYCYVTGTRLVTYDIIRIPEAQFFQPYRNVAENSASYVKRMFTSIKQKDYPINDNPRLWIDRVKEKVITEENIQNFLKYTFDPLVERLCVLYDLFSQDDFDPENPAFYDEIFYRTPIRHFDPSKTEKYKCNFHSFLTEQLSKGELIPVKSFYQELIEQ